MPGLAAKFLRETVIQTSGCLSFQHRAVLKRTSCFNMTLSLLGGLNLRAGNEVSELNNPPTLCIPAKRTQRNFSPVLDRKSWFLASPRIQRIGLSTNWGGGVLDISPPLDTALTTTQQDPHSHRRKTLTGTRIDPYTYTTRSIHLHVKTVTLTRQDKTLPSTRRDKTLPSTRQDLQTHTTRSSHPHDKIFTPT
ncbi:hypothetical protein RRG08_046450 [Elysia crispata]|uniref:Uncharacterized protein n=1 Tax=Elysia crispata TaxID=231223 RepID=A0AAE1CZY6_9GAST|nr:hypothetical protein RRG08_046450 [Elysia crispata]